MSIATAKGMNTASTQIRLSKDEVAQFHREGYLGPFATCEPQAMRDATPQIEAVLSRNAPDHEKRHHNRHLDSRLIHELVTHPAIVERMAGILGADLLLWRTNFFIKGPNGSGPSDDREIPWHQDRAYWPLEPEVVVSAWMAIDAVTTENSCVQVIPGSHRQVIPTVDSPPEMVFGKMADPRCVDTSRLVNLELRPGEFFLFNERVLHHSEANRSGRRRMGLAIRVVPPIVRVLEGDSPRHRPILISGQDRMGFNELGDAPTA